MFFASAWRRLRRTAVFALLLSCKLERSSFSLSSCTVSEAIPFYVILRPESCNLGSQDKFHEGLQDLSRSNYWRNYVSVLLRRCQSLAHFLSHVQHSCFSQALEGGSGEQLSSLFYCHANLNEALSRCHPVPWAKQFPFMSSCAPSPATWGRRINSTRGCRISPVRIIEVTTGNVFFLHLL